MKPYEILAGQLDLINRSIAKAHTKTLVGEEAEKAFALNSTTSDLEKATHEDVYAILRELSPVALGKVQAVLDDLRDNPSYEG